MQQIKKRMIFLDYLRIFAFISVLIGHKFFPFLFHLTNCHKVHDSLKFLVNLVLPFCFGGGAGVVVFFLVSGYVITYVLKTELPFEFLVKRIFRIYPLFITAVLLEVFLNLLINHNSPNYRILIPQLLLIGDLYHAPNVLGGVEWTLRVEIIFYFCMCLMRSLNIINNKNIALPVILVFLTLLLNFIPPIPGEGTWNMAYLNMYGPFLFLGVFIYLYENQCINLSALGAFVCLVFMQYWYLTRVYQPNWLHTHFALLAFLLFVITWKFRERLTTNAIILFTSELTYSVYLFHNWLFDRIKQWSGDGLFAKMPYTLILLILICAFFVKFIEKPAIKLGRTIYQRLTKKTDKINLIKVTKLSHI
ncbi:acyltransferase family protein [Legionella gresilensis]|uniref:acyltransferase family protein n=1 Tax=Legionella gresilensis TaxID=91823 RepID=UPI0010412E7E|nr:acyltransferase [Legionella gresilensis]